MVKFLNWFDISLPEFMDNQYGEFIILLGLWLLIGLIAVLVMRPIIRRLFARTKSHLDDKVLHILEGPIIMLVFFYGIVVSLNVLDDIPPDIRHGLQVLYQVVVSLVVVYLVYKVFRAVFVPLGTDYAKRKESSIDKTLLPVVDTIGGTIIILVGLFWVLGNLGVDVTVGRVPGRHRRGRTGPGLRAPGHALQLLLRATPHARPPLRHRRHARDRG